MSESVRCWKCGAGLDALPLPYSRRQECPACRAELHVCRMCAYFDPQVAKSCREPVADEVGDKDRANFCGYFQPGALLRRRAGSEAARAELGTLFGGTEAEAQSASPEQTRARLDSLFGK